MKITFENKEIEINVKDVSGVNSPNEATAYFLENLAFHLEASAKWYSNKNMPEIADEAFLMASEMRGRAKLLNP